MSGIIHSWNKLAVFTGLDGWGNSSRRLMFLASMIKSARVYGGYDFTNGCQYKSPPVAKKF